MPIKFSCPHCNKGLSVKEQLAGKKGICPECKKVVVIPGLPTPPVTPSAAAPAPAPSTQQAPKAPTTASRAPSAPSKATAAPAKAPATSPKTTGTAPRAPTPVNKAPSPASPKASPPKASPPPPAPPPRPEEVDAEAAALFSDEPAKPVEESKTVDFNCPFCDEALHLDAELAGKKTSCPECKRIIKVPELVKADPKDWRQAQDYQGPSGARRPTEPAPEGAWGSSTAKGVSQETIVGAGLAPVKRPPVPLQRRIILGTLAVAFVLALGYGGLSLYRWFGRNKEEKALREALVYADSDGARAKMGPTGQAALHTSIASFYLQQKSPEGGSKAREHLNKALSLLQNAPKDQGKRDLLDQPDAALLDLAHAYLELGDGQAIGDLDSKKGWDDTHRALQATLLAIGSDKARVEAVRQVIRGLVAHSQTARVLPLVATLYQTLPDEKLAGLSASALELLDSGHKEEAEQLASQVLAAFPAPEAVKKAKAKDPKKKITIPPLESGAVALALALQKQDVPKPTDSLKERQRDLIGQAEGLARQGDLDKALKQAQEAPTKAVRFEALLAMAGATKDRRALDEAVELAPQLKERSELDWLFVRLITIGSEKGVAEDRLLNAADAIKDRALRARAQLLLLRARLKSDKPVEEAEVDKIDPHYVAHALGRQVLAQQKVRQDSGWAKTVEGWTEPVRAFGFLGVALGLQGK